MYLHLEKISLIDRTISSGWNYLRLPGASCVLNTSRKMRPLYLLGLVITSHRLDTGCTSRNSKVFNTGRTSRKNESDIAHLEKNG